MQSTDTKLLDQACRELVEWCMISLEQSEARFGVDIFPNKGAKHFLPTTAPPNVGVPVE